jgi:hypothetical protein
MAADESTSTDGENPAGARELWEGVLDRIGTDADPKEGSTTKLPRARKDGPRWRGLSSRPARYAGAVALALLVLALAYVFLPGALGGGSAEPSRPASIERSVHREIRHQGLWRGRPAVVAGRRPGRHRRARSDSTATSARERPQRGPHRIRGHRAAQRREPEPPPVPPVEAPPDAPSEGTPAEPAPSEPGPESGPGRGEPAPSTESGTGGGLRDGSHGSPEFGL